MQRALPLSSGRACGSGRGDGPLVVDAAHWLVTALPSHHPSIGHNKQTSMRMAEDVLGPGTILSPEMAGWHFNWHLLPTFMANFLQKLEGTGKLQWSSHGTVDRARRHVLVLHARAPLGQ